MAGEGDAESGDVLPGEVVLPVVVVDMGGLEVGRAAGPVALGVAPVGRSGPLSGVVVTSVTNEA
jgi:hypothetical protein